VVTRQTPAKAARGICRIDSRLRADARGRDGSIREELAAGVVLRSGGRSAFGGKAEKPLLMLSLTAFDALLPRDSEHFRTVPRTSTAFGGTVVMTPTGNVERKWIGLPITWAAKMPPN